MKPDITILYYTANLISDFFANNTREHLLSVINDIPIVSVSHKPLDFGTNICVGDVGVSVYSVYRQILEGAKQVKTKYIACCEDDCLYVPEHFTVRPPDDTFMYNNNRWNCNGFFYYYRNRCGMCMGIAPTALMIEALEEKFAKFPDFLTTKQCRHWGEPGRYEKRLGLMPRKLQKFKTKDPTLTFNHRPSLGGRRRLLSTDIIEQTVEPWGKSLDVWKKYFGE